MKKIIADTNVYLRFLLNDIKSQAEEAEKLFKKAQKKKILLTVPQIIIFEIQFILDKYYGFDKTVVIDKLEVILAADFLTIEERGTFLESVKIFRKKNIGFVDVFLGAKAKKENAKIFTFDKKFSKLQK